MRKQDQVTIAEELLEVLARLEAGHVSKLTLTALYADGESTCLYHFPFGDPAAEVVLEPDPAGWN